VANDPQQVPAQPSQGAFLTTRWSRVVLAGDSEHPEAHAALSSLCQDYWRPLYYFARRKRHSPEDAQDLTQGFIMGLLESGSLAKADPDRGRFRTFLLGSFCHYLANRQRDEGALKRGGGLTLLSLSEDVEAEFLEQPVNWDAPTTTPPESPADSASISRPAILAALDSRPHAKILSGCLLKTPEVRGASQDARNSLPPDGAA
jgi:DNA-directed RNA polymerase specialized sigma24 family protein